MRQKARNLRRETLQTGGGPATAPSLTELEIRLLDALGKAAVDGLPVFEVGITDGLTIGNVDVDCEIIEENKKNIQKTNSQIKMPEKSESRSKLNLRDAYEGKSTELLAVLSSIDKTLKNIYELKCKKQQSNK